MEIAMAQNFGSGSQRVTPRDAQKGGQGSMSKERPDIALKQDEPPGPDAPAEHEPDSDGLTASQIGLLCEIEERDSLRLTQDKRRDLERLLSLGYIEPLDGTESLAGSLGHGFKLTADGHDFLAMRGAGLNEA
jgi:hypothetical protein